jgi:hypothetical protein
VDGIRGKHGRFEKRVQNLSQKTEGLLLLEACTRRWVSGIEMILRNIGCDWTQKA